MSTTPYRVGALDPGLVTSIRNGGLDVRGASATIYRRSGQHQCRSCLCLTADGEDCLLFSHQPFRVEGAYAEIGPVFIHRRQCDPYSRAGIFPPEMPRVTLVLRAYSTADEIVGAELVGDEPVEAAIKRLFANNEASYVHARNADYGCYICRIDRA
jgi:hypothetical protein